MGFHHFRIDFPNKLGRSSGLGTVEIESLCEANETIFHGCHKASILSHKRQLERFVGIPLLKYRFAHSILTKILVATVLGCCCAPYARAEQPHISPLIYSYLPFDQPQKHPAWAAIEGPGGGLFVASGQGVLFDGLRWESAADPGAPLIDVLRIGAEVFGLTSRSLLRCQLPADGASPWERLLTASELPDPEDFGEMVACGDLILLTTTRSVWAYHLEEDRISRLPIAVSLRPELFVTGDGVLCHTGGKHLYRIQGDGSVQMFTTEGLEQMLLVGLVPVSEGYIGYSNLGFIRLTEDFSLVSAVEAHMVDPEGPQHIAVDAVLHADGAVLAADYYGRILYYDPLHATVSQLNLPDRYGIGNTYGLYQDRFDTTWVLGTRGLGRLVFDPDLIQVETAGDAFGQLNTVLRQGGDYYLGTDEGLWRFNTTDAQLEQLYSGHCGALATYKGKVLVALENKLGVVQGSDVRALDLGGIFPFPIERLLPCEDLGLVALSSEDHLAVIAAPLSHKPEVRQRWQLDGSPESIARAGDSLLAQSSSGSVARYHLNPTMPPDADPAKVEVLSGIEGELMDRCPWPIVEREGQLRMAEAFELIQAPWTSRQRVAFAQVADPSPAGLSSFRVLRIEADSSIQVEDVPFPAQAEAVRTSFAGYDENGAFGVVQTNHMLQIVLDSNRRFEGAAPQELSLQLLEPESSAMPLDSNPSGTVKLPAGSALSVRASTGLRDPRIQSVLESRLVDYEETWSALAEGLFKLPYLPSGPSVLEFRLQTHADAALATARLGLQVQRPYHEQAWFWLSLLGASLGVAVAVFRVHITLINRRRRALVREVELRTRELQHANQLRARFVARMSHEIRNPLQGLLGLSQLLRPGQQLSAPLCEGLLESAAYLGANVENILDWATLEAGGSEVKLAEMDLAALCRSLGTAGRTEAARKGLIFVTQFEFPCDPCWIQFDAAKVRHILHNLMGNAIKFTDAGSVRFIATAVESDGGMCAITFTVSDTGPGIPEAEQEQIFSEFYQGRTGNTDRSGSGLGLAICRQYAELLGGQLEVRSTPGEGSSFVFTCRAQAIPAREATTTGPELSLAGVSILVAEDQPFNRLYLKTLLEGHGAKVTAFEHGDQALATLMSQPFDLALLDLNLPGRSGLDIAHALRDKAETLPLVALTAFGSDEHRASSLEAGFDCFLTKPVDSSHLIEAIRSVIDGIVSVEAADYAPSSIFKADTFDFAALRFVAGDDHTAYTNYLLDYQRETESLRDQAVQGFAMGDRGYLLRTLHQIAGHFSTIRFTRGIETIDALQRVLHEGVRFRDVPRAALEQAFADQLAAIRQELEASAPGGDPPAGTQTPASRNPSHSRSE